MQNKMNTVIVTPAYRRIQNEINSLENKLTAARERERKDEERKSEVIVSKIKRIHEFLGLNSFDEAAKRIKSVLGERRDQSKKVYHRLTPENRESISKILATNHLTLASISTMFGVSIPTIHNIKRSIGLVKIRSLNNPGHVNGVISVKTLNG